MQAIVYDCPDHPDAKHRCPTLRIFDGDRMVMQAIVTACDWRSLCVQIAAGLEAELQVIGPAESRTRVGELIQPQVQTTIDPQAKYEVQLREGWLF